MNSTLLACGGAVHSLKCKQSIARCPCVVPKTEVRAALYRVLCLCLVKDALTYVVHARYKHRGLGKGSFVISVLRGGNRGTERARVRFPKGMTRLFNHVFFCFQRI